MTKLGRCHFCCDWPPTPTPPGGLLASPDTEDALVQSKVLFLTARSGDSMDIYVGNWRQSRQLFVFLFITVSASAVVSLYLWSSQIFEAVSLRGHTRPLAWRVNTSDLHVDEVNHIVFVKVHKAASTTVTNILVRFSISRVLNVMFPKQRNLLSYRTNKLLPIISHPKSPPFLFDILCNHVTFDEKQIRPYFPADTKYIAILRNPWSQVRSAFYYYKTIYKKPYLMAAPSFHDYINNVLSYEPADPRKSYTSNRMSIDLGLDPEQIWNSSHVPVFVSYLDKVFHLVLIAERFDESVVLLKRLFHWKMKDIVYMRVNEMDSSILSVSVGGEAAHRNTEKAYVKKRFQHLNHYDVAVYNHFSQILQHKIEAEGPGFNDEVRAFRYIQRRVTDFCSDTGWTGTYTVPASKWNTLFTISRAECETMMMVEIPFIEAAKQQQLRRMAIQYGDFQASLKKP